MADARVLIVDDNPATVEFLDSRLRSVGYHTTICRDGTQALEAITRLPPDLVILDVTMPGMNGYQCCREIKRLRAALPVIILTAKSSPADRFWAVESGADAFFNKPVDPHVVVQRIDALLNGRP